MIHSPLFRPATLHIKGMPVYETPYLFPNYTAIDLPRFSSNRSKRLSKKMMQRVREKAYAVWAEVLIIRDPISGGDYMVCHPTVYSQLAAQIANGVST
jgi:hypothetical protein